jgi:FMNH2-dependent dimethyl sulfone monooxygenase
MIRLGLWTPLPHCIRPEPEIDRALDELKTPGKGLAVDRSFQFALDAVREAEDIGFDITLVAERLVAADLEAWVVSSALASHTSKIEIMTAVHPGIINPQLAAKMGASIDRLSGGRFAVNVVPGRRNQEFELYGNGGWVDKGQDHYTRVDEFIRVMKSMWTEDVFSFEGQFYQAREGGMLTKPLRRPHPPVFAASNAEEGKDIIARECDLWFVGYDSGIDAYETNLKMIAGDIANMSSRASGYGRQIGFGMSTLIACSNDPDALIADARAFANDPLHNVPIKALGAGLIGTPQTVADRIRRYEDMGVTLLMLQFHPFMDGLRRFADEVVPRLK